MTFRVGMKVVCVDAATISGRLWPKGCEPTVGAVYTITAMRPGFHGDYLSLHLAEIRNPIGYRAARFRPAVERKTDIGFAHEILRKVKAPARSVDA